MRKIKIGDCFENILTGKAWVFEKEEGDTMICCHDYKRISIGKAYMKPLPTLHLPIKGQWFDMILSGEKKEEYRDVKEYYVSRFCTIFGGYISVFGSVSNLDVKEWKPFKVLHLTHGYGHHLPQLWAHIKEITIGKGKPEWGAPAEDVFIIRLGEIFHTKNLKL